MLELLQEPLRFPARQLRGARDGHEGGAGRVAQQRVQLSELLRHLHQLLGRPSEADHFAVLQEHGQQGLDPLAGRVGQREQAQRVAGGRGVEHDHVHPLPRAAGDERGRDGHDREQLVQSRRRECDQVLHHRAIERGVEVGAAAQRVEELVHRVAVTRARLAQRAVRVELAGPQARGSARDRARRIAQPRLERVAYGMRGVGREEQHPARPVRSQLQRGRRSGGGLAHAALTPEHQEAPAAGHELGEPPGLARLAA